MRYLTFIAAFVLASVFTPAGAQPQGPAASDKAAYDQSSIARYREMFAAQDFDRSGKVTREEVQGNVDFTAVFDDIDIDRDGVLTRAELDRYLALQFGAAPP
jgi:Ca2+-binding EF-hand superfamily protein